LILGVNGRFLGARATGVQRFAAEMTRRLWNRAERAVLLLPKGVEPPSSHPKEVPVVRGRLSGQPWEQLELPRAARAASCDVILNPANTLPARGGPHVVIIHDVEPLVRPELFSWAFAAWYRWAVAPAARRAGAVITSSMISAEALVEVMGIERSRIRVADEGPEPFDQPATAEAVAEVRVRYGLDGPYLLAVGGTDPRKNIGFIRGVLARWREREGDLGPAPRLVVVSGGDARIFAATRSASVQAELDVGRIDDETLRALYTGAAAFVFPSLSEGFGRPPLEAMACGAPVVTSPYPAASEVLGDAAARMPLDADAWIAQLRALMTEDPARRAARRERGRAHASSHSWEAGADTIMAACREVAG
jgi:glycosyltransferase involved in cell wall biosynthesis